MIRLIRNTLVMAAAIGFGGCAYLGFHGPSIQSHQDMHQGFREDKQCLSCHHPDEASAPPAPHPGFTGCLKCHNDDNAAQQ